MGLYGLNTLKWYLHYHMRNYLVLDSEVDLLQAVIFEDLNGHGVLAVVVESLLL